MLKQQGQKVSHFFTQKEENLGWLEQSKNWHFMGYHIPTLLFGTFHFWFHWTTSHVPGSHVLNNLPKSQMLLIQGNGSTATLCLHQDRFISIGSFHKTLLLERQSLGSFTVLLEFHFCCPTPT